MKVDETSTRDIDGKGYAGLNREDTLGRGDSDDTEDIGEEKGICDREDIDVEWLMTTERT